MAKQGGPFLFNITIGNISFYIREGVGLVRTKSNLTAHRVKTDPAFENSRKSAGHFGLANEMASPIYKTIPVERREKTQFTALRNLGIELFHAGASASIVRETMEIAVQHFMQNLQQHSEKAKTEKEQQPPAATSLKAAPELTIFPPHKKRIFTHRTKRLRRSTCRVARTATTRQNSYST